MESAPASYREILRNRFLTEVKRNPAYSLRAFARKVGVAPSMLCEVLKGKKNPSPQAALTLCRKLKFSARETDFFCSLVELETAKSPELKELALKKVNQFSRGIPKADLTVDQFKIMAEWYHLPILEMTEMDGFDFSIEAVAQKLDLRPQLVADAIDRLVRLGLLERSASGTLSKADPRYVVRSPVPNEGLRKYHTQMLAMAAESLEDQSPKERVVGTETFTFDPRSIEVARKMTDEFFDSLLKLSRESSKKSELYHLGIQFFRLTDRKGRGK